MKLSPLHFRLWSLSVFAAILAPLALAAFAPLALAAEGTTINTVAGNGSQGYAGDNGPATKAALSSPHAVASSPDGSFFIADSDNNRIRKVATDGTITTVAGNGTPGFSGDGGAATDAELNDPFGVAVANDGTLYIADTRNSRVRKVALDGTITTYAGTGDQGFSGEGGAATDAQLNFPVALAVDDKTIYIADVIEQRVLKVAPDGTITTVAGNGTLGFSGDGGAATDAQFNRPYALAVADDKTLYIADAENQRVRKVAPDGTLTTVAGNGEYGADGDEGPATDAQLGIPIGLAISEDGTLYIADRDNQRVRKVAPDKTISTVAGTSANGYGGDGGEPTAANLSEPYGLALGSNDTLYIADSANQRIRVVAPSSATGTTDPGTGTTDPGTGTTEPGTGTTEPGTGTTEPGTGTTEPGTGTTDPGTGATPPNATGPLVAGSAGDNNDGARASESSDGGEQGEAVAASRSNGKLVFVTKACVAKRVRGKRLSRTQRRSMKRCLRRKRRAKRSVRAGGTMRFSLTVRNDSAVTVENTVLCDTLPRRTRYIRTNRRVRVKAGIACFDLGTLAPGQRVTTSVRVRFRRGTRGRVVNTAVASADNAASVSLRQRAKVLRYKRKR